MPLRCPSDDSNLWVIVPSGCIDTLMKQSIFSCFSACCLVLIKYQMLSNFNYFVISFSPIHAPKEKTKTFVCSPPLRVVWFCILSFRAAVPNLFWHLDQFCGKAGGRGKEGTRTQEAELRGASLLPPPICALWMAWGGETGDRAQVSFAYGGGSGTPAFGYIVTSAT